MAKPISARRFTELCNEWGIKYIPIKSNWASHNREGHGNWGPVNGVGIHHTGSDGTVADQCSVLWNGYARLPGPLCHSGIDHAGILRLAGWGRVNHFGLGSESVLNHVVNEDYKGVLKPGAASIDGNARFYGFEIMYSGSHPMSDAQRITAVRVSAMLCTEHGWKAESVIGHGEWQQGKWDPGMSKGKMMPMDRFRDEVEQAIKEGPKKPLPNRPKPPTTPPKGTITVAKGDTLMSLAEKHLGDAKRWADFVPANPSLVRALHIGETLTVPKK